MLLLISMEDRDWYIATHGYGIAVFTDAGLDYIGEQMVSDLSDGDYAEAFQTCFTWNWHRSSSGRSYGGRGGKF